MISENSGNLLVGNSSSPSNNRIYVGLILANVLEKVFALFFMNISRQKLIINGFPKVRIDVAASQQ